MTSSWERVHGRLTDGERERLAEYPAALAWIDAVYTLLESRDVLIAEIRNARRSLPTDYGIRSEPYPLNVKWERDTPAYTIENAPTDFEVLGLAHLRGMLILGGVATYLPDVKEVADDDA